MYLRKNTFKNGRTYLYIVEGYRAQNGKPKSRVIKSLGYLDEYGHIVLSKIYHELELDRFWNNKSRHAEFEYNANSIMKLLVFARLLYPSSKKKAHELKDRFFDILDFSLDNVYDSLSFFDCHSHECQRFMHERISEKCGRETDLLYYDVTNYYFERKPVNV